MKHEHIAPWWGAPKKFSTKFAERKISWLELFYDLVYTVAIARITTYFSQHPTLSGFLDYLYLFIMIFWGWFNGSMYHDLHGTPGIRTRLMTLWQMVAVAAMIVCLNSPQDRIMFRGTISIMVMQLYITYLWWSVGIYDKEHRRLNRPYTICFLLSLLVIFSTLFLHPPYVRIAFFASLVLNYLPPFYMSLGSRNRSFNLSPSMTERLGLFTIIMFGEVVTGAINGATTVQEFSWVSWGTFVLAILIVFALWWIFFALIADRNCKEGLLKGQVMIVCYIPLLMSLGMLGATFSGIFSATQAAQEWTYRLFAFRIAIFLWGTVLISNFLMYPASYIPARKWFQLLLVAVGAIIAVGGYFVTQLPLYLLFTIIFILLLTIIVLMTIAWLRFEGDGGELHIE